MNETTKTTVTSGNIGLGTLCLLTSIALIILHACGVLACSLWFCFLPIIFGVGFLLTIFVIALLVWLIIVITACIAAR